MRTRREAHANGEAFKMGDGGNLFASHVARRGRWSGSVCTRSREHRRRRRALPSSLAILSSNDGHARVTLQGEIVATSNLLYSRSLILNQ